MASHNALATVVIVGRTNVGKSTLFNRLSTSVRSIAYDQVGVTRDVLVDTVSWQGAFFKLVDTGGMSFKHTTDQIDKAIQSHLIKALEDADAIIFVCDARVGVIPEDREIARHVHRYNKPTFIAVNKVDNERIWNESAHEFFKLGFKPVLPISAQHGTGIAELLEQVVAVLPQKETVVEEDYCRVVLLGKPNVGKSSLMNLLLGKERSIVADQAGTTRESIKDRVTFYQQDICLVDTAGVRKKRSVNEPLEQLMVKSTMHAVKNADIVLLLIDASEGDIVDQELKLAFYVFQEQYKGLIILFNKQDKATPETKAALDRALSVYPDLMKKVEVLNISCKTGANVGKILPLVDSVIKRYKQRISSDELTLLFREWLVKTPLYKQEQRLIVRRIEQVKSSPPTIVIHSNQHRMFSTSHFNFFDNRLRKEFKLGGVPIKFFARR